MEFEKICKPIKTFEEAMRYSHKNVDRIVHKFPKGSVSYVNERYDCHCDVEDMKAKRKIDRRLVPKTLVCHDMKGGYLEDKYANGCSSGNGYTFYRWSNIDTFVYFSHHLVTIPPIGWVNLAHANNVKILGTLITEFKDGITICNKIFETEKTCRDFADALVNICLKFNFDGWLLNIENPITQTELLLEFVKYLTIKMHEVNPDFTVIWYDSVTCEGKLKWQNKLNEKNKCYFDACDGIFLNYTWNEDDLLESYNNAGSRNLDVYVGMDVFGRNFYAGGKFNCNQAARVIRERDLSMAIFAPGWTNESLVPKSLTNFYEIFLHKDNAFWLKLYPYLYTRPIEKDFVTTFYTGADKHNYNLNLQQQVLQVPIHSGQTYFTEECRNFCECIQLYSEGCKPNRLSYLLTTGSRIHRMFTCNIRVEGKCTIQMVVKEGRKENKLEVIVLLERNGTVKKLSLVDFKTPSKIDEEFEGMSKNWVIKEYSFDELYPMDLVEIALKLDGKSILLGGFSVKTSEN